MHLYEQGYGGDTAKLTQAAVEVAKRENFDVVLVDTAGRMQDNAPLMKALANVRQLLGNKMNPRPFS